MTRLGLVSDVHWMVEPPASSAGWHGTGGELPGALDRLALALAHFAERDVDAVVVAGDLAHHGDVASLSRVLRTCADASAPVLVVAGNHDVDGDLDRLAHACALADVPGVTLATTAGELHRGLRIAGVHVGETDGWFGARLRALPDPVAWGREPVVLISHYPALSPAAIVVEHGFPYPGDLLDRRELADLLAARPAPTLVIGGHVHARAAVADGPVLQLTGGALVEPPYECAVIDVEASAPGLLAVRRECLRLRGAAVAREPVFAPEHDAWLFDGTQWKTVTKRPGGHDETEHRQDPHDAHRQPAAS